MIGIVDYNAGNITSVERSLSSLGIEYLLSKNPSELVNAQKIIFPGVGNAGYAMEQLKIAGFDVFLREWVSSKRELLGICLGAQIVFDFSEEGDVECLGLISGKIRNLKNVFAENGVDFRQYKIPHMGWNNLTYKNSSSRLFSGVDEKSDFYFVHSYLICPQDETVVKASANYGVEIPACVEKDNITVFQFHPEKSGKAGLKILQNFCTK